MGLRSDHAKFLGRAVLGSYLAVHGAQKLFGAFGGHGLDGTGGFYESIGLRPGRQMAALAGASEFGGGLLTATGIAYPLGPIMIASTMSVASTTHRANGALGADGGFELPLTNLTLATVLAAVGPGAGALGPRLPRSLTRIVTAVGVGAALVNIIRLVTFVPDAPPAIPSGDDTAVQAESTEAD